MAATVEPAILPLNIHQGATWRRTITWETGDPFAPVNLTGFTARMQIRALVNGVVSPIALVTLTNASSDGLVLNANGTIDIEISDERAAILAPEDGPYVYDIRIVSPTGDKIRAFMGPVTVTAQVTLPA
jgi:hypothetical protein